MSIIHQYTETLTVQNCINCGIPFGMPQSYDTEFRRTRKNFYCPNGHPQHYLEESAEDKLRRELAQANDRLVLRQQTIDRLTSEKDTLERSNRSVRAHAKRIKTRASAGVCPVDGCRRHFQNLQQHIANKHPSWKTAEEK